MFGISVYERGGGSGVGVGIILGVASKACSVACVIGSESANV